jgi:hypothetical protein
MEAALLPTARETEKMAVRGRILPEETPLRISPRAVVGPAKAAGSKKPSKGRVTLLDVRLQNPLEHSEE